MGWEVVAGLLAHLAVVAHKVVVVVPVAEAGMVAAGLPVQRAVVARKVVAVVPVAKADMAVVDPVELVPVVVPAVLVPVVVHWTG